MSWLKGKPTKTDAHPSYDRRKPLFDIKGIFRDLWFFWGGYETHKHRHRNRHQTRTQTRPICRGPAGLLLFIPPVPKKGYVPSENAYFRLRLVWQRPNPTSARFPPGISYAKSADRMIERYLPTSFAGCMSKNLCTQTWRAPDYFAKRTWQHQGPM